MVKHQSLDDLLWGMVNLIGEHPDTDDCVIYLLQDDLLVQTAAYGLRNPSRQDMAEPVVIPIGEGIVGTVAVTLKPELVQDTRLDPRYVSDQFTGCSELAVPILFQGQLLGVLDSESERINGYSSADQQRFQFVANAAASRIAWFLYERQRAREEDARHMERLEALGRLAGGIAHDFNNLLAVTSLSIDQLAYATSDTERLEASETAFQSIEQARDLMRQLMTFAPGGKPLFEVLSLPELLRDALSILCDQPRLEVTADVSDELPAIWGDPIQLMQAVQNLLISAAEATKHAGHVTLSAHSRDGPRGRLVEVNILDSGPDIPQDVQHRIFDPYFSTQAPNIGLGLSAAYWIVHRHNGVLTASNTQPDARFTIMLPAYQVAVTRSPASSQTSLPPLNILILDDEEEVATGLRTLLIRQGHMAVAVHDGKDVVPTWVKHQRVGNPFHLAILDLSNPGGIGGLEALAMLRSEVPASRAIVMSGYSEDPVMSDYLFHGFNGRLAKPFRMSELNDTILRALQSDERLLP